MIYPIHGTKLPLEGSKLDYLYPRTRTHKHRGLDFPAPLGTRVIAAETGVVVKVVNEYTPGFRGYGKVIVIEGVSGRYFLYGHLDKTLVSFGDKIALGQPIGLVGKTAYTKADPTGDLKTGPHLHFEISRTPYPQPSESPRLNPRIALTQVVKAPIVQPTIEPHEAAKRLKKIERFDRNTVVISIAIIAVIWLLTLLKR